MTLNIIFIVVISTTQSVCYGCFYLILFDFAMIYVKNFARRLERLCEKTQWSSSSTHFH